MKYKIKTRDWKGIYDNLSDVIGWYLVGGEDEIETGSDCRALVFADSSIYFPEVAIEFDLTPQEAYDILIQLDSEDEVNGYTWDSEDEEVIIKIK